MMSAVWVTGWLGFRLVHLNLNQSYLNETHAVKSWPDSLRNYLGLLLSQMVSRVINISNTFSQRTMWYYLEQHMQYMQSTEQSSLNKGNKWETAYGKSALNDLICQPNKNKQTSSKYIVTFKVDKITVSCGLLQKRVTFTGRCCVLDKD